VAGGFLHPHAAHRSAVERQMLWYASQEARNSSAGDALRLYWGLAEAEQSRPLLRDSQAETSATLSDLDELLRRGLAVPVDATALRSQNLSLADRGLELDLTVQRLNEQLKQALKLDTSDPNWRIWPATELKLIVEPIDVDVAVAEGLSLRPELRMLRMLSANLDSDTLPVARQALGAINAALGSSESSCCCCREVLKKVVALCSGCELATRERQLAQYRADREAAVTSEIRQGAFAVVTSAARVSIAEDTRSLRATSLKNLEGKLPTGGASAFEVHQARLDLLDARREVIAQLIAWETARVELREAQGKLVDECRVGH
jgi:outer membrane protein TolC